MIQDTRKEMRNTLISDLFLFLKLCYIIDSKEDKL